MDSEQEHVASVNPTDTFIDKLNEHITLISNQRSFFDIYHQYKQYTGVQDNNMMTIISPVQDHSISSQVTSSLVDIVIASIRDIFPEGTSRASIFDSQICKQFINNITSLYELETKTIEIRTAALCDTLKEHSVHGSDDLTDLTSILSHPPSPSSFLSIVMSTLAHVVHLLWERPDIIYASLTASETIPAEALQSDNAAVRVRFILEAIVSRLIAQPVIKQQPWSSQHRSSNGILMSSYYPLQSKGSSKGAQTALQPVPLWCHQLPREMLSQINTSLTPQRTLNDMRRRYTTLFCKQSKFNLFHEDIEGYSKLVFELEKSFRQEVTMLYAGMSFSFGSSSTPGDYNPLAIVYHALQDYQAIAHGLQLIQTGEDPISAITRVVDPNQSHEESLQQYPVKIAFLKQFYPYLMQLSSRIETLIGSFQLDPNRVLDLIIDIYEFVVFVTPNPRDSIEHDYLKAKLSGNEEFPMLPFFLSVLKKSDASSTPYAMLNHFASLLVVFLIHRFSKTSVVSLLGQKLLVRSSPLPSAPQLTQAPVPSGSSTGKISVSDTSSVVQTTTNTPADISTVLSKSKPNRLMSSTSTLYITSLLTYFQIVPLDELLLLLFPASIAKDVIEIGHSHLYPQPVASKTEVVESAASAEKGKPGASSTPAAVVVATYQHVYTVLLDHLRRVIARFNISTLSDGKPKQETSSSERVTHPPTDENIFPPHLRLTPPSGSGPASDQGTPALPTSSSDSGRKQSDSIPATNSTNSTSSTDHANMNDNEPDDAMIELTINDIIQSPEAFYTQSLIHQSASEQLTLFPLLVILAAYNSFITYENTLRFSTLPFLKPLMVFNPHSSSLSASQLQMDEGDQGPETTPSAAVLSAQEKGRLALLHHYKMNYSLLMVLSSLHPHTEFPSGYMHPLDTLDKSPFTPHLLELITAPEATPELTNATVTPTTIPTVPVTQWPSELSKNALTRNQFVYKYRENFQATKDGEKEEELDEFDLKMRELMGESIGSLFDGASAKKDISKPIVSFPLLFPSQCDESRVNVPQGSAADSVFSVLQPDAHVKGYTKPSSFVRQSIDFANLLYVQMNAQCDPILLSSFDILHSQQLLSLTASNPSASLAGPSFSKPLSSLPPNHTEIPLNHPALAKHPLLFLVPQPKENAFLISSVIRLETFLVYFRPLLQYCSTCVQASPLFACLPDRSSPSSQAPSVGLFSPYPSGEAGFTPFITNTVLEGLLSHLLLIISPIQSYLAVYPRLYQRLCTCLSIFVQQAILNNYYHYHRIQSGAEAGGTATTQQDKAMASLTPLPYFSSPFSTVPTFPDPDELPIPAFPSGDSQQTSLCEQLHQQHVSSMKNIYSLLFSILSSTIIPAHSLMSGSLSHTSSLWSIIQLFSAKQRYQFYSVLWQLFTIHPTLHYYGKLTTARTKYFRKRLVNDNMSELGRLLPKFLYSNPFIAFDLFLDQIISYEALISPIIEIMPDVSLYGFDTLIYMTLSRIALLQHQVTKDEDWSSRPAIEAAALDGMDDKAAAAVGNDSATVSLSSSSSSSVGGIERLTSFLSQLIKNYPTSVDLYPVFLFTQVSLLGLKQSMALPFIRTLCSQVLGLINQNELDHGQLASHTSSYALAYLSSPSTFLFQDILQNTTAVSRTGVGQQLFDALSPYSRRFKSNQFYLPYHSQDTSTVDMGDDSRDAIKDLPDESQPLHRIIRLTSVIARDAIIGATINPLVTTGGGGAPGKREASTALISYKHPVVYYIPAMLTPYYQPPFTLHVYSHYAFLTPTNPQSTPFSSPLYSASSSKTHSHLSRALASFTSPSDTTLGSDTKSKSISTPARPSQLVSSSILVPPSALYIIQSLVKHGLLIPMYLSLAQLHQYYLNSSNTTNGLQIVYDTIDKTSLCLLYYRTFLSEYVDITTIISHFPTFKQLIKEYNIQFDIAMFLYRHMLPHAPHLFIMDDKDDSTTVSTDDQVLLDFSLDEFLPQPIQPSHSEFSTSPDEPESNTMGDGDATAKVDQLSSDKTVANSEPPQIPATLEELMASLTFPPALYSQHLSRAMARRYLPHSFLTFYDHHINSYTYNIPSHFASFQHQQIPSASDDGLVNIPVVQRNADHAIPTNFIDIFSLFWSLDSSDISFCPQQYTEQITKLESQIAALQSQIPGLRRSSANDPLLVASMAGMPSLHGTSLAIPIPSPPTSELHQKEMEIYLKQLQVIELKQQRYLQQAKIEQMLMLFRSLFITIPSTTPTTHNTEETQKNIGESASIRSISCTRDDIIYDRTVISNGITFNTLFIQHCILPRIRQSNIDALFAYQFIHLLMTVQTPGFLLLHLIESLTQQITSIIVASTTIESGRVGIFFNEILTALDGWILQAETTNVMLQETPYLFYSMKMRGFYINDVQLKYKAIAAEQQPTNTDDSCDKTTKDSTNASQEPLKDQPPTSDVATHETAAQEPETATQQEMSDAASHQEGDKAAEGTPAEEQEEPTITSPEIEKETQPPPPALQLPQLRMPHIQRHFITSRTLFRTINTLYANICYQMASLIMDAIEPPTSATLRPNYSKYRTARLQMTDEKTDITHSLELHHLISVSLFFLAKIPTSFPLCDPYHAVIHQLLFIVIHIYKNDANYRGLAVLATQIINQIERQKTARNSIAKPLDKKFKQFRRLIPQDELQKLTHLRRSLVIKTLEPKKKAPAKKQPSKKEDSVPSRSTTTETSSGTASLSSGRLPMTPLKRKLGESAIREQSKHQADYGKPPSLPPAGQDPISASSASVAALLQGQPPRTTTTRPRLIKKVTSKTNSKDNSPSEDGLAQSPSPTPAPQADEPHGASVQDTTSNEPRTTDDRTPSAPLRESAKRRTKANDRTMDDKDTSHENDKPPREQSSLKPVSRTTVEKSPKMVGAKSPRGDSSNPPPPPPPPVPTTLLADSQGPIPIRRLIPDQSSGARDQPSSSTSISSSLKPYNGPKRFNDDRDYRRDRDQGGQYEQRQQRRGDDRSPPASDRYLDADEALSQANEQERREREKIRSGARGYQPSFGFSAEQSRGGPQRSRRDGDSRALHSPEHRNRDGPGQYGNDGPASSGAGARWNQPEPSRGPSSHESSRPSKDTPQLDWRDTARRLQDGGDNRPNQSGGDGRKDHDARNANRDGNDHDDRDDQHRGRQGQGNNQRWGNQSQSQRDNSNQQQQQQQQQPPQHHHHQHPGRVQQTNQRGDNTTDRDHERSNQNNSGNQRRDYQNDHNDSRDQRGPSQRRGGRRY